MSSGFSHRVEAGMIADEAKAGIDALLARVPHLPQNNLRQLQARQGVWQKKNFPGGDDTNPILGVVEEVGELAHAVLKARQGIRGTIEEHEAAAMDAVGDIVIYLIALCNKRGWCFSDIVFATWAAVERRDWKADPKGGAEQGPGEEVEG
jgi:NTP pyrophosphatase (non-canonical NTP hydrolase)